jgi:uncharacterized protein
MKMFPAFIILLITCFSSVAQDSLILKRSEPFVLGTVLHIQSKILAEDRMLNIYLPPGYNSNDTARYPVIYLLDGSADEDFIHIAGLVQFANFPWVNMLPNTIVVGIANVDRRRDFTYPTTIQKDKKDFPTTGGSKAFISFIEEELQPFINRMYKTNSTKTIIGQSLGGLVATEILLKKPKLFTNYIIVSPSLWWDNESLLAAKPAKYTDNISVFIAVGKEGKRMIGDSKRLAAMVKTMKTYKMSFKYFGDENHASIMHKAVYEAFENKQQKEHQ